ncbi:hypothetical protein AB9K26_11595 [Psychroserpens sp. XS_ASV72]|uniref:hypothetical protein n=1 Tax=Psychroserpens sp. XS_ASV72 TaxID=3241293 RepID=UPI00351871C6
MKFKTTFILLLLLTFSCKDEKRTADTNVQEKKEYFSFTINAVIEKDDEFTLFYLDEENTDIKKENSVSVKTKGSSTPQELFFQLPDDTLPLRLLLRYGNDEKSQTIQIVDAKLSYHGKDIIVSRQNFFQFFNPNKFIDYNQEEFKAVSKEMDGTYSPTFISRKVLENKIDHKLY